MKRIVPALFLLAAVSCSTTRVLPQGELRLASNKIEILGDTPLTQSDVSQYIKQQPNKYFMFGWNPFLNIYNWQDGSDKGLNPTIRKIGTAPVVFNSNLAESSCENIADHLESLGYYNSEVTPVVDVKKRLANVRYVIKPGKRYRIDSLEYVLPDNPDFIAEFKADSLNSLITKGSYLSESELEAETSRGAAYFRNLGYYDFSKNNYFFEADTLGEKNILSYQIRNYTRNENPDYADPVNKYHFGNVTISHTSDIIFREDILRELNVIKPGDLYSESLVNNAYNRFSSLKLFNGVSVEMTPADSATVDCNIRLTQSKQQGMKVDVEASTNSSGLLGLSPQLSLYHKNIFHGGEWLTLGFTGNFQFNPQTYVRSTEFGSTATLNIPRIPGLPYSRIKGPNIPRSEFKASYNYQNRPEYTRNMAGFSLGVTGQIGTSLFYQVYPLQANFIRLYNLDEDFQRTLEGNPYLRDSYKSHVDAGLGGMIYHTTNSDIVPRTPYNYERVSFDFSGNFFSMFSNSLNLNEDGQAKIFGVPFTQYVRAQLDLGRTLMWGRDNGQALALHAVTGVGFAYGNSTAMPFEKQFYVGGASSMRGWQARSLGPGCDPMDVTFSIPSQTGDFKFEFDVEYRFDMFWKLEGALFGELGNVWNIKDMPAKFYESIAGDWGLGIRVDLDFILIRLDCGFPVYDPAAPEGSRFVSPDIWLKSKGHSIHFGVGYPF